jgi:hypothetical protein
MKTLSVLSLVLLFGIYSIAAPPYGNLFHGRLFPVKGQPVSVSFSYLHGSRLAHGTNVQWSVTSESGIVGYILERTYFDPADPYSQWNQVASHGATGVNVYRAGETTVYPGSVSYRVRAILNNGTSVVSNYVSIWIGRH